MWEGYWMQNNAKSTFLKSLQSIAVLVVVVVVVVLLLLLLL